MANLLDLLKLAPSAIELSRKLDEMEWYDDDIRQIMSLYLKQIDLFTSKITKDIPYENLTLEDYDEYLKGFTLKNPEFILSLLSQYFDAVKGLESVKRDRKTTKQDIDKINEILPSLQSWHINLIEIFNETFEENPERFEDIVGRYIKGQLNVDVPGIDYDYMFRKISDIDKSISQIESVSVALSENMESQGYSGSGFTLGSGITIPFEYNIDVSGLEEFGALNQAIDESSKSIEQTDDLAKNATSSIMGQYQNLTEEQVSLNASIAALNFSGIGMPFINISTSVEEADKNAVTFSDRLSNIAGIAGQIGGAFMSVDEEIGKAIMSAGTLTEGVAGIFKAFEGDEVNGLGLMAGIQGGFAGLQGLFGGEPGSDSSQLLGGLGSVGAGVAGLLTDREPDSFHLLVLNA